VLRGNGDGTFQAFVHYGSGGKNAIGVAVADVNADGKPDLLVVNVCPGSGCGGGVVGVLLNKSKSPVPQGSEPIRHQYRDDTLFKKSALKH
jgi:hypothetical protein